MKRNPIELTAPTKMKVHAAIDEHPICRALPKAMDDQSHGSESTQQKYIHIYNCGASHMKRVSWILAAKGYKVIDLCMP
jgi:hypothetical protein